MSAGQPALAPVSPALRRLASLVPLGADELRVLGEALRRTRSLAVRRELFAEGRSIAGAVILANGWAARVRLLADGRRQFVSFLLPGDIVGMCRQRQPLATTTVVALTDISVCHAPPAPEGSALEHLYGVCQALDEAYLCAHVVRLGRLNAQERIGDLLLEFYERLGSAGMVNGNGFEVPLTQEMIGDALGLTSVHVNRMLQQARRDGSVLWDRGRIRLPDPERLTGLLGRHPPRVSGEG